MIKGGIANNKSKLAILSLHSESTHQSTPLVPLPFSQLYANLSYSSLIWHSYSRAITIPTFDKSPLALRTTSSVQLALPLYSVNSIFPVALEFSTSDALLYTALSSSTFDELIFAFSAYFSLLLVNYFSQRITLYIKRHCAHFWRIYFRNILNP